MGAGSRYTLLTFLGVDLSDRLASATRDGIAHVAEHVGGSDVQEVCNGAKLRCNVIEGEMDEC